MTCKIDKSIFSSDEALDYNMDKCVADTMIKMGGYSARSCQHYLVAISHEKKNIKGCTTSDINETCRKNGNTFKVNDAEKLCTLKLNAEKKFWCEKNGGESCDQIGKSSSTPSVSNPFSKGPFYKDNKKACTEGTVNHNIGERRWKRKAINQCFEPQNTTL